MDAKYIIVRKAKLADVPGIVSIAVKLMKYHVRLDGYFALVDNVENVYLAYFRKCIKSSRKIILVAEYDKKIVGYVLGDIALRSPVYKIKRIGILSDMYVLESFRGKGIARLLLQMLFKWFKSKNISNVELSVHSGNVLGISVWDKCGFKGFMIKQRIKI